MNVRVLAVLAFLDLIPAFNEVLGDVQHSWAFERHMNLAWTLTTDEINDPRTYIVPRHPRGILNRKGIADIVVDLFKVHNTCIIVILSREEGLVKVRGVNISKGMRVRVPSPEAKIKATDSGVLIIDKYDLSS